MNDTLAGNQELGDPSGEKEITAVVDRVFQRYEDLLYLIKSEQHKVDNNWEKEWAIERVLNRRGELSECEFPPPQSKLFVSACTLVVDRFSENGLRLPFKNWINQYAQDKAGIFGNEYSDTIIKIAQERFAQEENDKDGLK